MKNLSKNKLVKVFSLSLVCTMFLTSCTHDPIEDGVDQEATSISNVKGAEVTEASKKQPTGVVATKWTTTHNINEKKQGSSFNHQVTFKCKKKSQVNWVKSNRNRNQSLKQLQSYFKNNKNCSFVSAKIFWAQ